MLTTKKVVLVLHEEHIEDIRYEAIEIITDVSDVERVWRCNKTPAIEEKNAREVMARYPYITVPEFIFGPEDFISFCHSCGFECGEFCTGKKIDTSKERCFLCAVGHHQDRDGNKLTPLFVYNQNTPRINDIIMYESENFFVKIEYGCLKKGMVMICPKEHILSAARIPDSQMAEYEQVMEDVEFLLKAVYGDEPVIFFEHGSAPSGFSSHERSIVHAHTHVAWGVKFDQRYLDMVCLERVNHVKELSETKYFSYQEGAKGQLWAVSDPNVYVQRQYPRQVIGMMLGIPNEKTNWRKEAFMDNIIGTFEDFYRFLKANGGFLCERIKDATDGFVKGYEMRTR